MRFLAAKAPEIIKYFDSKKCRIVPVAGVARCLGVSVRLLWQWIEAGLLKTYKPPASHIEPGKRPLTPKKGVDRPALLRFLNRLKQLQEAALLANSPPPVGRPASATAKLIKELQPKGILKNGMTPAEAALLVGVSSGTVRRAIRSGAIIGYKASSYRYRIGRKPSRKKRPNVKQIT